MAKYLFGVCQILEINISCYFCFSIKLCIVCLGGSKRVHSLSDAWKVREGRMINEKQILCLNDVFVLDIVTCLSSV